MRHITAISIAILAIVAITEALSSSAQLSVTLSREIAKMRSPIMQSSNLHLRGGGDHAEWEYQVGAEVEVEGCKDDDEPIEFAKVSKAPPSTEKGATELPGKK
mmetsp:Transcript_39742/g.79678  ORF Transcript_39742/g.79678 Transcript_39742/m.79678 type:complete len:103 (-) Transcript_39742:103-411(-)|eukprot:CAMPEP_0196721116 /NCGR_PEP_ID=MMETSP1091-20130531/3772_1 /TAXON_ID=302021 /ORGANISM="Rhodomonas sp., Strain CCMP768" /LENGTH=102 /DNA_ID=CAMNT_0042062515 /DNA_START=37 /DNA_END=345 /DNA_ORIENTATION=-